MTGLLTDEFAIGACLERHAASVRETTPNAWEFTLAGNPSRRGTARADLDWLALEIPLSRPRSKAALSGERLTELLALAGRLAGPAKFGLDPATKRLHLQAEIPLLLEDDPMERIDQAFVGFEQALAASSQTGVEQNEAGAALVNPRHAEAGVNDAEELKARCGRWKQLCEESVWPLHERASSKLAVSLDVPGSFCQAIVEAAGPGGVRIRHEAGQKELSDVARQAMAVFLLTGSRVVRMARAYAELRAKAPSAESGNGETADSAATLNFGWEILLGDPPALFEFDRALSALSMACRLSANELAVLTEDAVARRYLAAQGMVP